jgi:hypothetical protein
MAGLFFLLLFSAACWLLVFSKSARRRLSKPRWKYVEDEKENNELVDAMTLAGALIAGFASTILFIAGLIAAIRGM